ncbi:MAG: hypothetical protein KGK07_13550 [Chloroflexota bacterium]|nr:hypothetical protein [Chloroflexota bacterium]
MGLINSGLIVTGGGQARQRAIVCAASGGSAALAAGVLAYLTLPAQMLVTGWDLLASASDTFTLDCQQTTYAAFPTGFASIFASAPALAAAQKAQARGLAITLAQYTVLQFVLGGTPVSHQITLALYAQASS